MKYSDSGNEQGITLNQLTLQWNSRETKFSVPSSQGFFGYWIISIFQYSEGFRYWKYLSSSAGNSFGYLRRTTSTSVKFRVLKRRQTTVQGFFRDSENGRDFAVYIVPPNFPLISAPYPIGSLRIHWDPSVVIRILLYPCEYFGIPLELKDPSVTLRTPLLPREPSVTFFNTTEHKGSL